MWLSLFLPRLALEVFPEAWSTNQALIVVEGQGSRRPVVDCNRAALEAGIGAGMSEGSALALAPGLIGKKRDLAAESAAIERLALWAGQFTPTVSPHASRGLLLEIRGCIKLFGGIERLIGLVKAGIAELGYRACIAVAPTPTAAWIFSRSGIECVVADRGALEKQLARLAIELLDLPQSDLRTLHGIGANTFGDCLKLPRSGLARRTSPDFVELIDRALGKIPDPRPTFQAPSRFQSRVELPAEVHDVEALLFAARRMLFELQGFLIGRRAGIDRFTLRLIHSGSSTPLEIGLSAPNRDAAHWLSILREHLARTRLASAVEALLLEAGQFVHIESESLQLFREFEALGEERMKLVGRLQARLGADAVRGLAQVADHRPELAWRQCAPGETSGASHFRQRPLWLLAEPEALASASGIEIESGPERIESGWWDGSDVRRDYFVAREAGGARIWIYREIESKRWFIHGLFD